MRAFFPRDQPGPGRPGGQVDQAGDLGDPRAVTDVVVGLDPGNHAASGTVVMTSRTASPMGKPTEYPTWRVRHAAAKPCVAPAASQRATTRMSPSGRGRAVSGRLAIARHHPRSPSSSPTACYVSLAKCLPVRVIRTSDTLSFPYGTGTLAHPSCHHPAPHANARLAVHRLVHSGPAALIRVVPTAV
jgi:hypothetical protein